MVIFSSYVHKSVLSYLPISTLSKNFEGDHRFHNVRIILLVLIHYTGLLAMWHINIFFEVPVLEKSINNEHVLESFFFQKHNIMSFLKTILKYLWFLGINLKIFLEIMLQEMDSIITSLENKLFKITGIKANEKIYN